MCGSPGRGLEPDHPVAPGGLARLSMVEEYRAGLAEGYYYDGVRGLTDQRLAESENGFEKSRKYDEDAERTKLRLPSEPVPLIVRGDKCERELPG